MVQSYARHKKKHVRSANGLTLGNYRYLLGGAANWALMEWDLDLAPGSWPRTAAAQEQRIQCARGATASGYEEQPGLGPRWRPEVRDHEG
ncbi:hypothetical protein DEF28_21730 [Marinitenerispora sediminis]|uniref:Uncharacterized protein n=1 Tax=Marinitenerispora sediminis TaxID=1931232 RepID=A0A368T2S9_9ACTN|nr:hypothetical protein DEF28_21730 [Marinitenerispora sediminis]RCV55816.1 hypothetical protein DEF24_17425 [Marinitenerispora sediminis]